MENLTTMYLLNKKNHILSVSGPWDRFAEENNGVNVFSSDVCGRSLWDFVVGDFTRIWLETIFQLARLRNTMTEQWYRCDSPEVKRFMKMRIVPDREDGLRIEHKTLVTEERPVPVYIRYGPDKSNVRTRCSICGRVKLEGVWKEPRAEYAETSREINVAYSVCTDCRCLLPGTDMPGTGLNPSLPASY